tara:strand:+ start:205 stop:624 length:420 start_codon:yes stop_codon:yes gene_type:complete
MENEIMDHFPQTPPALTKNQTLVMGALSDALAPLTAYTILDKLRKKGFRAPLQVYRALDKLVEYGMVHRLESINAFVACQHPEGGTDTMVAFTICGACGEVAEISDASFERRLQNLATTLGFTLNKSTIELNGLCSACG